MHLLFADRLPEQTIEDLEARGHVCVVEPELTADELPARIAGFDGLVVRSTKVKRAVFEPADRLALVIRAGAGHQHDRHRRRRHHGRLRLQRPRPQRGRGRRAHHGAAAGDRPADRGQRGRPAQRSLGQEELQQGRRPARLHDGHHRPRLDRPRRRGTRGGVRHPGPVAGEARSFRARRGAGRGAGHPHARLAGRAGVLVRHREPPRPVERGHPAPGRRRTSSS